MHDGIVRTCVRKLGLRVWHADYEDALQEGRLVAWRKAPAFDGRGTLQGFVGLVVRRHLRAWWNKQRRRGLTCGGGPKPPPVPGVGPLPDGV